jgi:hypothetical protein
MRRATAAISLTLTLFSGCASFTTKITGSGRAGTEQLLLTGTADQVICLLNFQPLIGARVFLDDAKLSAADKGWITFALRRAMARQGVLTVEDKKDAQVVMEAAIGAYGTDEADHRLTTPSAVPLMPVPLASAASLTGGNALIRKNRQDAVIKLALAAYDVTTHRLVWESGTILNKQSLDRQFFGTTEIFRRASLPENKEYPRRRKL